MPRSRTVAVVGAGAAGLVAARELLREGHAVTVFEKSHRIGGTWAYDPRSDSDGSLYASLRNNLPRELMGFSDGGLAGRVFAGDPRRFPGHREVLAFLEAFAEEAGVAARVRLGAEVVSVAPAGVRERWRVAWRGREGEALEEVFEAVVVCNGHCTVPRVPKIQGIDKWPGKQMHSHNYCIPEPFRDQIVVVIGLGASGIDITREISHVAAEVHIACRYADSKIEKLDIYKNVCMHAEVECVQDEGEVCFKEGSSVFADTILYCTGYKYHFPFLHLEEITVDDNRVGPLYKHVFPPKYAPNLSFIGLPAKTIIFFLFELEAKWVAGVLSETIALPSEEDMLDSVKKYYRRMEETGKPRRRTHELTPEWVEQMNWLASEVGMPALEGRMCELYLKAAESVWSLDDGYRDNWGEEIRSGSVQTNGSSIQLVRAHDS